MLGSSSFQECASQCAKSAQEYQNSSSSFFSFINFILDWTKFTCIGSFIHGAHDEILAAFTILLAIFTLALWASTSKIAEDARTTGENQVTKMQASIAEANRAAVAMEKVASAVESTAKESQGIMQKQMRAYIAVDLGVPTCQEGNLRFAAAPVLINTGLTPAKNVSNKIKCAILDLSNTTNYTFDESASITNFDATFSPRQPFVINNILGETIPESELEDVMQGNTKRFYVWGTVTYDDIFGNSWKTNFCHNFVFYRLEGTIKYYGYYYRTHNDAT